VHCAALCRRMMATRRMGTSFLCSVSCLRIRAWGSPLCRSCSVYCYLSAPVETAGATTGSRFGIRFYNNDEKCVVTAEGEVGAGRWHRPRHCKDVCVRQYCQYKVHQMQPKCFSATHTLTEGTLLALSPPCKSYRLSVHIIALPACSWAAGGRDNQAPARESVY